MISLLAKNSVTLIPPSYETLFFFISKRLLNTYWVLSTAQIPPFLRRTILLKYYIESIQHTNTYERSLIRVICAATNPFKLVAILKLKNEERRFVL